MGDGLCIVSEGLGMNCGGTAGERFRQLLGNHNGSCSQPSLASPSPGCTRFGASLDASHGVEYDFCRVVARVVCSFSGRRRLGNDRVVPGERRGSRYAVNAAVAAPKKTGCCQPFSPLKARNASRVTGQKDMSLGGNRIPDAGAGAQLTGSGPEPAVNMISIPSSHNTESQHA